MSAIYMSGQLSTALSLMEGDHHQGHFQAFTLPNKDPPILFPFMIGNSITSDSSLSYGSPDHHLIRQHQAILEPQHMIGVSSASSVFTTPFPTVESIRDDMIEPSWYDQYDMGKLQVGGSIEAVGGNWTPPAKMRITRKTSADPGASGMGAKKPRRRAQAYEDMSSQPNLGVIRVCSDCNTTKTPLWRSGPCGPKSLCNACGIRQRKARRAMMASAWALSADGIKAATATPSDAAMAVHPKVKKEKRADVDLDRSLPFKKRCKVVQQDHTAVPVASVAVPVASVDKATGVLAAPAEIADASLSRDLVDNIGLISCSRPSPQPAAAATTACSSFWPAPALPVQHDEITDAAMLLMTLSCGLVRS